MTGYLSQPGFNTITERPITVLYNFVEIVCICLSRNIETCNYIIDGRVFTLVSPMQSFPSGTHQEGMMVVVLKTSLSARLLLIKQLNSSRSSQMKYFSALKISWKMAHRDATCYVEYSLFQALTAMHAGVFHVFHPGFIEESGHSHF